MDGSDAMFCAAIAALWAYVVWSGKRCEKRNDGLSKEIKETKDGVIERAEKREAEARSQAVMVATALQRQNELSTESIEVMREIKELTHRTVRALRRYSKQDSGEQGDDSDTSKFFQDGVESLERKR